MMPFADSSAARFDALSFQESSTQESSSEQSSEQSSSEESSSSESSESPTEQVFGSYSFSNAFVGGLGASWSEQASSEESSSEQASSEESSSEESSSYESKEPAVGPGLGNYMANNVFGAFEAQAGGLGDSWSERSSSEESSSEQSSSEESASVGPDVHDPFGLGPGSLVTTPLADEYRGEERGMHSAVLPEQILGMKTPTTAYASGPESHRASTEGGILRGADGKVASSTQEWAGGNAPKKKGAQAMWQKDKNERLNFAMDAHGSTYLSDPRQEFLKNKAAQQEAGHDHAERINHSTMVGGGDVAGAGTARVRDGKVESLGDDSGHYKPTITQTAQVASTMAGQGVLDPARASIELSGKGPGQKGLTLSAQELLAYEDDFDAARQAHGRSGDKADLAKPEAVIRARHAKKDAVLGELKRTAAPDGPEATLEALRASKEARKAG
jgi:hypothetical protein